MNILIEYLTIFLCISFSLNKYFQLFDIYIYILLARSTILIMNKVKVAVQPSQAIAWQDQHAWTKVTNRPSISILRGFDSAIDRHPNRTWHVQIFKLERSIRYDYRYIFNCNIYSELFWFLILLKFEIWFYINLIWICILKKYVIIIDVLCI